MTRRSINVDTFTHQNPIPCATRIGPLIESSIIVPFDPGTRDVPPTLDAQITNLFTHMGAMLEAADAGWDDMAKVTFFVKNPAESRAAINGPWLEKFPDETSRPARHNLAVPMGDSDLQVTCVFTAYVSP